MERLAPVTRWLVCRHPRPFPRLRLVAIPGAGSGPGFYHRWTAGLPSWIELRVVIAPGRETRFSEPVPSRLQDHVEAIARDLAVLDDLPTVLFGHSMGGLVAFELARCLRDTKRSLPRHLLVSSVRAPFLAPDASLEHVLPAVELQAVVRRRYGGFPAEVEDHPELLAWSIELLRGDLRALETHRCVPSSPLPFPISALGGDADPSVPVDDLRPWAAETSSTFSLRVFSGDHRYIENQQEAVLSYLHGQLAYLLPQE